MAETKFTPDPWVLETNETTGRRTIRSNTRRRVAALDLRVTDADATLMTAAPALYKALDRFAQAWDAGWRDGEGGGFIPTHEQMNELHDAYDAAHEALALARGESPSPDATTEVKP